MSTVAYGSLGLEPGYMIAGHASGAAAALSEVSVQEVPVAELQARLRAEGQILKSR